MWMRGKGASPFILLASGTECNFTGIAKFVPGLVAYGMPGRPTVGETWRLREYGSLNGLEYSPWHWYK